MHQAYPKWIPKNGTDADKLVEYKVTDPKTKEVTVKERVVDQIHVLSEKEHKEKNMDHYLFEQAGKPAAATTVNEAQHNERERAAMIAERFPGGYAVADAIRAIPPTIQEVIAGGYPREVAGAMVLEEKRKYDAGEPPYGPPLPQAAPVVGQQLFAVPAGLGSPSFSPPVPQAPADATQGA